jgi:hypothetical protein
LNLSPPVEVFRTGPPEIVFPNIPTGNNSTTIYFGRFVNLDFEHLEWLGRRIGGPTGMSQLGKVDPAQPFMIVVNVQSVSLQSDLKAVTFSNS